MQYCINNEKADKIVSLIVERGSSLDNVYDYLNTLDTKSLSMEDFAAIFDGLHGAVSQDKEKAYMLYALFAHNKMRPHYILDVKEIKKKGFELTCLSSGKLCLRHWNDDVIIDESEICDNVRERMRFTSSLLDFSHKIFRHSYLPFRIVDPHLQDLRVFQRIGGCKDNEWKNIEPDDKSFMLFYMQENTSLISSSGNHSLVYCANDISIALPIVKGIATKPCYCYDGSYFCSPFCYMEVR